MSRSAGHPGPRPVSGGAASPAAGPLDGILVVALEQAVAAPLATRHLADLGARVIKIERPDEGDFARHYDDSVGPGFSSWFVWLNRGKESVALDVKSPHGRTVLAKLMARADVFVHNLAPGAIDRLGFSIADLRQRYPRLITCSLSGYGPDGPYRDRKAYDLLIQSEAGLVSLTGTPEQPAKAGVSVADIAGGMYAYSGTLAALLRRSQTGQGSHVEVSLFDALCEWLSHQRTLSQMTGRLPKRAGTRHATIAPYGAFRCADGKDVVIAVQNTREWRRLCDAIGLPDLVEDARFATNEQRVASLELDETIGRRVAQLTSDELIERLETAGLAWGRVNDMHAVVAHPQLEARDRWVEVGTPAGAFPALRPPIDISGVDVPIGDAPGLGQHTAAVLAWLDEPGDEPAGDPADDHDEPAGESLAGSDGSPDADRSRAPDPPTAAPSASDPSTQGVT
jgi:itaconate CoA-transferase